MTALALAVVLVTAVPQDTLWLEVTTRVGERSGVLLEQVEAVEVDAEGRLYVLDGFAHQLRAFSAQGTPSGGPFLPAPLRPTAPLLALALNKPSARFLDLDQVSELAPGEHNI